MGILDRWFAPRSNAEAVPIPAVVIASLEELERLMEQNEAVHQIITAFTVERNEIRQQAQFGGGMTPEDVRIEKGYAKNATEALIALNISIDPLIVESF
jgi:hypothetical protein